MSITIKLEEVREIDGKEETIKRELTGKLNYYAIEAASKFYDNVNAEVKRETGKDGTKNLLDTYNNLVITESVSHLREVLWFMFSGEHNGNLQLDHIEAFINSKMEDDDMDAYGNLVEDVLITMESSGFFIKQIRQNLKGLEKTILPQMMKTLATSEDEAQAITGQAYYEQLNELIIRGEVKGFYTRQDIPKEETSKKS